MINKIAFSLIVLLFCATGAMSSGQAKRPLTVSGCKLLRYPGRYSGKIVSVRGRYTWGFEVDNLTFDCPGSIEIQLSLSAPDKQKFGFVTDRATMDAMSQLPPGEHPGDNLTERKQRYSLVTVVGLFRCHYDFPTCKGATRDNGSIVVKSMRFHTPMSESRPLMKPGDGHP
jgi:hypothetical protein